MTLNLGRYAKSNISLHTSVMVRPCFLVIDREYAGSISTRKLVIETAKFNVITSYSSLEAIETLRTFPAVDGAVLDATLPDMPCAELIAALKKIKNGLPVIAINGPGGDACDGADHHLDSFDPRILLGLLQSLVPEQAEEIEKNNERLSRELHRN